MRILFRNMTTCDDVAALQRALQTIGLFTGQANGIFGESTEQAVIAFQLKNRLNADGIVGPKTAAKLGLQLSDISFPVPVPNGKAEIIETFGNPLLAGFAKASLDFVSTPPDLNHVFKHVDAKTGKHGFYCHKLVVINFTNVYQKIVDLGLAGALHTFDGCFNIRNIRGKDSLSTHSWGIAVDHDAARNPLGAKPVMNEAVVKVFEGEGFRWGGNWKRPDGMHFQYATGY